MRNETPRGYTKARNGEIGEFTGISSPYEPPLDPEVHLKTSEQTVEECIETILECLEEKNVFNFWFFPSKQFRFFKVY